MTKKIQKNFLVVSNHNNDVSWIPQYTDRYTIYDRSEYPTFPPSIDMSKVIMSPNIGYNIYDYFRFIIDRYDDLPERIIFTKGNCFPRHVRQEYFESIMNNETFTPLLDESQHKPKMPSAFIKDGVYYELNNDWYFNSWKSRYFDRYNDFLRYVYNDPHIPEYIPFAPGASYVVLRENILRLPKKLYQDMMFFVSHCQQPAEAHMIERALYTLWTSDQELNESSVTQPISQFVPRKTNISKPRKLLRKAIGVFMGTQVVPSFVKKCTSYLLSRGYSLQAKIKNKLHL